VSDAYPKLKVAAVQAACAFIDRAQSTAKACDLIREAGRHGAQVIVFPEGFIPSHPNWFHHHIATSPKANAFSLELFKNAVEIPGKEIALLGAAAKDAGAYVVMGVCEKLPGTLGTMFNTQVYLGPDGAVIGKHQKTMPTVGERIVHTVGYGDTFGVFPTKFGPMSSLICGENGNAAAIFALAAQHTRIHAMSWPPYVGPQARPLRSIVELKSRAFATMANSYVVSACGTLDEHTIESLDLSPEHKARLRDPLYTGGSVIVAPDGEIIAGPLDASEGILYADCDIEQMVRQKMSTDYAGHYNRPDIFELRVNKSGPQLLRNWTPSVEDERGS
jgi:nitrilase